MAHKHSTLVLVLLFPLSSNPCSNIQATFFCLCSHATHIDSGKSGLTGYVGAIMHSSKNVITKLGLKTMPPK
ncbi:hypothetical protein F5Y18DRAFT_113619 [Xylariaceae sp. FL1019]|nr:hypothetical protein F5Y18DRAFT_113619 [Xylariaceae sp. FL1019]